MTGPVSSDRHSAPEGRKQGVAQFILLGSLLAALCLIAYLLLFNQKTSDAKADERKEKAVSQLHTSSSTFKMPVFKKPEPLPVTEAIIVKPEPIAVPVFKLDPLPKPEPLAVPESLSEPLPKTEVIVNNVPTVDRPITDEERRLAGGVSGSKGVSKLATNPSQGSGVGDSDSRRTQRVSDDSLYESEYEHLSAPKQPVPSSEDSEPSAADIDRLGQLASLYGVSETRDRAPAYKAGDSGSRYEPRETARFVAPTNDSGDGSPEKDSRGLSYQPINTTQASRSSGQGIDLSSTQVVSAEAKTIKLDYLLKRGTYIGCVLKTRIVSDQAGYISCGITEDIYSADGSNLLLPRGSDVLGEYKPKSLSNGKVRLSAVWDAVTTPDGVRVNLGSPSTGRLGAAGIGGHVNNHYGKKVGIPILLSLFRTAIDYRTRNYTGESGEYKTTGSDAADDVLSDQMSEYESIRPTLTKHQGSTIGIMVARDVSFEQVLTGSR